MKRSRAILSILKSALLITLLLVTTKVWSQGPNWTVTPGNYQYSMSIVTFLHMDGKLLTDPADRIGAFVGTELRGVAAPIYVDVADRYLAYLTVYANTENEVISFQVYDHASNKTVTVSPTAIFKIDGQLGDVFQALSAASPVLQSGASLLTFGFTDVVPVKTEFTTAGVEITLEFDQSLDGLKPEFTTSPGAKVYVERAIQQSGTVVVDFSNPVVYTVLSEDESALQDYTITVVRREFTDNPFSCTNVITVNGDGLNDTWVVQESFKYRDYHFEIFDANGRILFDSIGYDNDWNGFYKGVKLDRGQYYYNVTGGASGEVIKGSILLIH